MLPAYFLIQHILSSRNSAIAAASQACIADSLHKSKLAALPSERMRAAAMTEPGYFDPELANTASELSAFRDAPWQMPFAFKPGL